MVGVFMGIDDTIRHGRPNLAKHLDHSAGMGQVGLSINDHTSTTIDEPGVSIADTIFLVDHCIAVIADLVHLHEYSLLS
jgi:hypothetical protein